jgi:spermidine synthase
MDGRWLALGTLVALAAVHQSRRYPQDPDADGRLWNLMDRQRTPDGEELLLYESDGDFTIQVADQELMGSRAFGSEESLARLALQGRKDRAPRVLIGGLGLGFTLRAALDVLPRTAEVVVAEIVPAVVRWNQQILGHLADRPLDDPRVRVRVDDVLRVLDQGRASYHAVLLDVDNGPNALTRQPNDNLYSDSGLTRIRRALAPGGVLTVWSSKRDPTFEARMKKNGFSARPVQIPPRRSGELEHTIYVASLRG